MDEQKFLDALFGNKPDGTYINIWTLPQKRSNFFSSLKNAKQYIQKTKSLEMDLYISCGIFDKSLGKFQRGEKKDIIGLPALYMDIDVADKDAHEKQYLPPTIDAAVSLVHGHGIDPSIIVNTGHGIHTWWVFKEPLITDDPNQIYELELVNARLQATIQQRAEKQGWKLDSTYDVTRVMRIPGTYNRKIADKPKQVKIIYQTDVRYADTEDFEGFILSESEYYKGSSVTVAEKEVITENLVLNSNAQVDQEKFDALAAVEPRFFRSWSANRPDLRKHSASELALSISSFAAAAGWTDQEIANLIIAFYRKHLSNKKLVRNGKGPTMKKALRPDFIAATIAKARSNKSKEFIKDYEENVLPSIGTKYNKQIDPDGKKIREFIRSKIGLDIVTIIKYKQEEGASYEMKVIHDNDIKKINFPDTKSYATFSKFRECVYNEISKWIILRPMKNKGVKAQWDEIFMHFRFLEVVREIGDYTVVHRMRSWIADYLEGKAHLTPGESLRMSEPFIKDGHWHIYAQPFRQWAYSRRGQVEGVSKTELDLTKIKCKRVRYNIPYPDNPSKRKPIRPWRIPKKVIKPSKTDPTQYEERKVIPLQK